MSGEQNKGLWIKSDDEDSSIDKYKLKKEKVSSSELNDIEIDDESKNHAALSAPKVPKKKNNGPRKRGTVIVQTDEINKLEHQKSSSRSHKISSGSDQEDRQAVLVGSKRDLGADMKYNKRVPSKN